MSSTVQHLTTPSAPWKASFLEHLSKMDSPEFVLSTLMPAPGSASSGTPAQYLPRARFCIFRGMWGELPENKHYDGPKNERVFESELPTFTTDVRMQKVPQLFATGAGKATDESQMQGSGGGGPCEAVFWMKNIGQQWRIKGTGFVVADDIEGKEGPGKESSGVRTVKSEIGERMRVVKEGKEGEWSWQTELTGHFGHCSPGMRGSWRNPPPGTKADKEPDQDHQLGQKIQDLDDKIARSNFRVVIIKPDEVEHLDLSDPAKSRRRQYTFVKEDGQGNWTEELQWP